jgi:hypothetical protein
LPWHATAVLRLASCSAREKGSGPHRPTRMPAGARVHEREPKPDGSIVQDDPSASGSAWHDRELIQTEEARRRLTQRQVACCYILPGFVCLFLVFCLVTGGGEVVPRPRQPSAGSWTASCRPSVAAVCPYSRAVGKGTLQSLVPAERDESGLRGWCPGRPLTSTLLTVWLGFVTPPAGRHAPLRLHCLWSVAFPSAAAEDMNASLRRGHAWSLRLA